MSTTFILSTECPKMTPTTVQLIGKTLRKANILLNVRLQNDMVGNRNIPLYEFSGFTSFSVSHFPSHRTGQPQPAPSSLGRRVSAGPHLHFLNRKRALSLDGLDRVLAARTLTVRSDHALELLRSASTPATDPIASKSPVVSPSTAMTKPGFGPESVIETIHVLCVPPPGKIAPVHREVAAHWQRSPRPLPRRTRDSRLAAKMPPLHHRPVPSSVP